MKTLIEGYYLGCETWSGYIVFMTRSGFIIKHRRDRRCDARFLLKSILPGYKIKIVEDDDKFRVFVDEEDRLPADLWTEYVDGYEKSGRFERQLCKICSTVFSMNHKREARHDGMHLYCDVCAKNRVEQKKKLKHSETEDWIYETAAPLEEDDSEFIARYLKSNGVE